MKLPRCIKCGRILTSSVSIKLGMGPTCRQTKSSAKAAPNVMNHRSQARAVNAPAATPSEPIYTQVQSDNNGSL